MKITVEKKKKSVVVLDWGHAPFHVQEKHSRRVYIPDGFTVETFCFTKLWVAQTSVQGDSVQYQFFLKADPTKTSGWQKSASAALQVANERIKNKNYKAGTNGALVVGVTYPSLQEEIIRRFGPQLDAKAPSTSSQQSQPRAVPVAPQPEPSNDCDDEPEQEEPATQPIEDDSDMEEVEESYKAEDCAPCAPEDPGSYLGKSFQMEDMFEDEPSGDQPLEPILLPPADECMLREYSINAEVREMESAFTLRVGKRRSCSVAMRKSLYGDDFRSGSFEETENPDVIFSSNELYL